MPTRRKHLTVGSKFGHLTIISDANPIRQGARLISASIVKCDCGTVRIAPNSEITRGRLKSCGSCKWNGNFIHGDHGTKLYNKWKSMIYRCNHPFGKRNEKYAGISVCEEWHDYENFKKWAISHGWKNGLSIDRIDPKGNYEPSNCRFITMKEQANNKSNTIFLTVNGETKTLMKWASEKQLPPKVIRNRLSKGWSHELALSPIKQNKETKHAHHAN